MKTKSFYHAYVASRGRVRFALLVTAKDGKRSSWTFCLLSQKYGVFIRSRFPHGLGKIRIFQTRIGQSPRLDLFVRTGISL